MWLALFVRTPRILLVQPSRRGCSQFQDIQMRISKTRPMFPFHKLRKRKRAKWQMRSAENSWLVLHKVWVNKQSSNNHQNIKQSSKYQAIMCVSFVSVLNLRIWDAVKWRTSRSSPRRHLTQLASGHWKTLKCENQRWKLMKYIYMYTFIDWKLLKDWKSSWFRSFAQLCTDHLVQLFEPGSVRIETARGQHSKTLRKTLWKPLPDSSDGLCAWSESPDARWPWWSLWSAWKCANCHENRWTSWYCKITWILTIYRHSINV